MATRLSKEAFLAITAVAWADGRMRKEEIAGLMRAAKSSGLDDEELMAIQRAAKEGVTLDQVELGVMNRWERALTFAFANWLAKLDGIVNAEELATLRALGDRLDLESARLQAARSAVFDIAALPDGNRPDRFDFTLLEERLAEKLPGSFRDSLTPPEPRG